MSSSVVITGRDLRPETLAAVARDEALVTIEAGARERIRAAAVTVARAALSGRPVYGVTTGLGHRVVDSVDGAEAAEFSLRTLRGRATSVGDPLSRELTRAAMVVRLNGLCAGGSITDVALGEALLAKAAKHDIGMQLPYR